MDLTLGEFRNLARKWESEGTKLWGRLESVSPAPMNVNMPHASVSLSDEALTLREGETVTIQLLSLLQYQYSASEGSEVRSMTLEVKALVWRCILSESSI